MKKYTVNSAILLLTKKILLPIVFTETTRKRGRQSFLLIELRIKFKKKRIFELSLINYIWKNT